MTPSPLQTVPPSSNSEKGPVAVFDQIMIELRRKATNAAIHKKPTMWAYYGDMADGLFAWFGDSERDDGAYAGAALALSQKAERDCPNLARREAAHLWAMGIYARRILAAWGAGVPYKPSLDWLRQRAGVDTV